MLTNKILDLAWSVTPGRRSARLWRNSRSWSRSICFEQFEDRCLLSAVGLFERLDGGVYVKAGTFVSANFVPVGFNGGNDTAEQVAVEIGNAWVEEGTASSAALAVSKAIINTSVGDYSAHIAHLNGGSFNHVGSEGLAGDDGSASAQTDSETSAVYKYHAGSGGSQDLTFHGHLIINSGFEQIITGDALMGASGYSQLDMFIGGDYYTIGVRFSDNEFYWFKDWPGTIDDEEGTALGFVALSESFHVPIVEGEEILVRMDETLQISVTDGNLFGPSFAAWNANVYLGEATAAFAFVTGDGSGGGGGPAFGDFNYDELVDCEDYQLWLDGSFLADANEDGLVNELDLVGFAANTTELIVSTETDEMDGNYAYGDLSLREAIALAGNDTLRPGTDCILFGPGIHNIQLSSQLSVSSGNNINIYGLGADVATIDAQGTGRVLNIGAGATVTLSNIHITGGTVTGQGGGIYSAGSLLVERCQIDGNAASTHGGGIFQAYSVGSTLSISDSTFAENSAYMGGGIASSVPTIIKNSTVSSNNAARGGAGIYLPGAGSLQIVNSTVVENVRQGVISLAPTTIFNSIIAKNTISDLAVPYSPTSANNLVGFDSSLTNGINNGVNGNQVGGEGGAPAIDPLLGSLSDNGGRTTTHQLLTGSLAIDAGNDYYASGLEYDQRGPGFQRLLIGGSASVGNVDIGAIEFGSQFFSIGGSGSALAAESNYTTPSQFSDFTALSWIEATDRPEASNAIYLPASLARTVFSIDTGASELNLALVSGLPRHEPTIVGSEQAEIEKHQSAAVDACFSELDSTFSDWREFPATW